MFEKYNEEFFNIEGNGAFDASGKIMPYIMEKLQPKSIVDFGCGTGERLKCAQIIWGESEAQKRVITGVDGEYTRDYLQISEDEFVSCDLCEPIDLNRKYDLAISLEVAEHLPESKADIFIENITKHSDVVLFSAAVPGQGGVDHFNEQYPSYWKQKFAMYGYEICDYLRAVFWEDEEIPLWYRQNMMLFVKHEYKDEVKKLFDTQNTIENIIHPGVWEAWVFADRNLGVYFPYGEVEKDSKIAIYGAGFVGKEYVEQLLATQYCQIVKWCDRLYSSIENMPIKVSAPDELENVDYDVVVIAIAEETIANSIKEDLKKMNIPENKIVWRNPIWTRIIA